MHIRSVVFVNVAMASLLLLAAGCRMPWSKRGGADGAGAGGGLGLDDPTLLETTDIPSVYDNMGGLVSGARFEDTLAPVQGVTFAPVYFAFDSYALAPSEVAKIEQVAMHLQQNANHVLVVEGHCDERGSNEYNLSLGENRAISVRTRLVELGVLGDRIQTRSYGEEKPAVMGSGEEVWRLNRRGEFALFQK
ncbi:MAG: OmpA family protein [Kiritimatiellae bacterium]|jgi:peptidoglycan-associated lipoprotein|nr:OmpA family protein [Kiritimatiellia bacterium]MDD3583829.1 OmpA family protein [Kiritimatiellia bacterium]HON48218.1 OmpA family protein [Kiritimatiellia bacterium]